jgi:hypothetical protein
MRMQSNFSVDAPCISRAALSCRCTQRGHWRRRQLGDLPTDFPADLNVRELARQRGDGDGREVRVEPSE